MALELLDVGDAGVGWLNAAVGAGGVAGAVLALALVGRRRLAADFGLGLILWGVPIALIGVFPDLVPVLVLLAVVGVGNTIADIAGLTLIQRAIDDEVLARVFGVLESLWVGDDRPRRRARASAHRSPGRARCAARHGALLPVLAVLYWRRLAAIDAEAPPADAGARSLARDSPVRAAAGPDARAPGRQPRPRPRRGRTSRAPPGGGGRPLLRHRRGACGVTADGRGLRTLEAGDHFGEIALLRDVPRTATVSAQTELELYALDRDEFVAAVTGHAASAEAADAVIGARLGSLRAGMASI